MRVCPCCEDVEKFCECSREDIKFAKQSIRTKRKLNKKRRKQQLLKREAKRDYVEYAGEGE